MLWHRNWWKEILFPIKHFWSHVKINWAHFCLFIFFLIFYTTHHITIPTNILPNKIFTFPKSARIELSYHNSNLLFLRSLFDLCFSDLKLSIDWLLYEQTRKENEEVARVWEKGMVCNQGPVWIWREENQSLSIEAPGKNSKGMYGFTSFLLLFSLKCIIHLFCFLIFKFTYF